RSEILKVKVQTRHRNLTDGAIPLKVTLANRRSLLSMEPPLRSFNMENSRQAFPQVFPSQLTRDGLPLAPLLACVTEAPTDVSVQGKYLPTSRRYIHELGD